MKPLKVNSFDELLSKIELKVKQANDRWVQFSRQDLTLEEGDFIKWINESYFSNILQNWSNAKEFLWSSSDSDSTPLDTDIAMVKQWQWNNTKEILNNSMSNWYWSIKFILKKDSFWNKCINTTNWEKYDDFWKYEIFKTCSEEHYWVRTWIATTDIDSIVFEDTILYNKKEEYFINIVQNWFYIPVYDNTWKIIFTFDDFEKYKKIFDWIEKFEWNDFELKNTDLSQIKDSKYQDIWQKINQSIVEMQDYMNTKNSEIENIVFEALKENNIDIKDKWDRWIVWAEIVNCWSTWRWTSMLNLPWKEELFASESLDIDITVHLDKTDTLKIEEVIKIIHEKLETTNQEWSWSRENGSFQLKSNENKFWFRIDILFITKNQLREYDTATALEDRYKHIEKKYWKEKLNQVKSQIILAKNILKDNGVYKKQDWWLSWVWVENWILSNWWSLVEAFKSFVEVSEKVWDNFDEFKKSYSIIDPWMNVKFDSFDNEKSAWNSRDNYVYKLSEVAYRKFIEIWKKI